MPPKNWRNPMQAEDSPSLSLEILPIQSKTRGARVLLEIYGALQHLSIQSRCSPCLLETSDLLRIKTTLWKSARYIIETLRSTKTSKSSKTPRATKSTSTS